MNAYKKLIEDLMHTADSGEAGTAHADETEIEKRLEDCEKACDALAASGVNVEDLLKTLKILRAAFEKDKGEARG